MTWILFIILSILSILSTIANSDNTELKCSERNGKQTFRIVQFTDTHFGSNQTLNNYSAISLTNLLSYEKPDFVSLSGDIVSGYDWDGKTQGFFKDMFDQALFPIISSKTPWGYTLGNHDDQGDWNRTQIVQYAKSLNYSYTEQGPDGLGGVTNYVLTVFSNDSNGNSLPIFNIWYLDSLDTNCYGVTGWNCVEFENVEWYKQQSIELETKYGKKLPGIMYIHIPLPELLNLYNNPSMTTIGRLQDSGICCWSLNTGLFSVMIERGDIFSVWHGHDHDNDFYGNYHGITIGYGRKTAFGGYGPKPDMSRGTRVIEINCDQFSWQTWIRENNGTKRINETKHTGSDWLVYKECCGSDGSDEFVNRNLDQTRWNHLEL